MGEDQGRVAGRGWREEREGGNSVIIFQFKVLKKTKQCICLLSCIYV